MVTLNPSLPRLPHRPRLIVVAAACLVVAACDEDRGRGTASISTSLTAANSGDGGDDGGSDDTGPADGAGDDAMDDGGPGDGDAGDDSSGSKFDLGSVPGDGDAGDDGCDDEDGDGQCACTIPEHVPCDGATQDLFEAIGLNCPGELAVQASVDGSAQALGVRGSFGTTAAFDPREGSVYAVLGSGSVAELDSETPADDSDAFPTHCNEDLGEFDPGEALPSPLRAVDVMGDCVADPTLIGMGDCSKTVQEQFDQGSDANDYAEMRLQVTVPPDVVSFSYDFAFFSTEYPTYFGSSFNDMYVGWLESEKWTGNISFDSDGNPISLNAGFLDYKDDDGALPELAGTCMQQHAGTDWLTTTAGVTPGEDITVVFAIFDLSDSILDSYVFVDNFQWGCDPAGKPSTQPEG